MKHLLAQAPTETPVTIAEAKDHCKVDGTDEDAWFTRAVSTASSMCEEICERAFCTQQWRLSLDAFPNSSGRAGSCCCEIDGVPVSSGSKILLPRARATSIIEVKYYDASGTLQTMDPADYQLDDQAEPGELLPAPGGSWPSTQSGRVNAVQVVYECGYGTAADVDGRAKQAVLFLVAHWHLNREAVLIGTISKDMELSLGALLSQLWHGRMW